MSAALAIYSTQAAPAPLAGWLQRVLQPVVEACRFNHWLPVEVRPTGAWAGWSSDRQSAPDRRVAVTNRICFFSNEQLISLYLHETTHRILEDREVATHGPHFFCVNAILLLRSASFFRLNAFLKLDLYDLQDAPTELENEPGWRGIVLNWALPVAAELAATDASAEALADEVCGRWKTFLQEREKSRVLAVQQIVAARKYAAAQAKKIESLQSSIFFARTFLIVGWVCFLSVMYFVL